MMRLVSALASVLSGAVLAVRDLGVARAPHIPLPKLTTQPFAHTEAKFYLPRTFKTSWRYMKPGKYRPHQGAQ
jgi:hypothetical protein